MLTYFQIKVAKIGGSQSLGPDLVRFKSLGQKWGFIWQNLELALAIFSLLGRFSLLHTINTLINKNTTLLVVQLWKQMKRGQDRPYFYNYLCCTKKEMNNKLDPKVQIFGILPLIFSFFINTTAYRLGRSSCLFSLTQKHPGLTYN